MSAIRMRRLRVSFRKKRCSQCKEVAQRFKDIGPAPGIAHQTLKTMSILNRAVHESHVTSVGGVEACDPHFASSLCTAICSTTESCTSWKQCKPLRLQGNELRHWQSRDRANMSFTTKKLENEFSLAVGRPSRSRDHVIL